MHESMEESERSSSSTISEKREKLTLKWGKKVKQWFAKFSVFVRWTPLREIWFLINSLKYLSKMSRKLISSAINFQEGQISNISHKDLVWNWNSWFNDSFQSISLRDVSHPTFSHNKIISFIYFFHRKQSNKQHNNKKNERLCLRGERARERTNLVMPFVDHVPRRHREMKCVYGESRIFLAISLFFCWFQHWPTFNRRCVSLGLLPFSLRSLSALPLTYAASLFDMIAYAPWRDKISQWKNHQSLPRDIDHASDHASLYYFFLTFVSLIAHHREQSVALTLMIVFCSKFIWKESRATKVKFLC